MKRPLFPSCPVVLIDDEPHTLHSFEIILRQNGINHMVSLGDSRDVIPEISRQDIEVMILDLWMPHLSGEELLSTVTRDFPDIPVVVITGINEVDTAVKCMKTGAFDYLVKPVDKDRLVTVVSRAIELRELRRENALLREGILSSELAHPGAFSAIITRNEAMKSIFHYVEAIAGSSRPVLITGETGVGKELVARAIHSLSNRNGHFVAVDISGIDDTVFADTLFGHKKGAFTGVPEARRGLIEQASGGTLFLDEIGDLSPVSQLKLLRLIQEREYLPLGSDMLKKSDARIIVATNRDINKLLQSDAFRKDLYYRLRTHHIHLPPLRERMDDLPLLAAHFLEEASKELGKKKPAIPAQLNTLLGTYSFPGNIRELRAMVFDALSSHRAGTLSLQMFKIAMGGEVPPGNDNGELLAASEAAAFSFHEKLPTLREAEQLLIERAMNRAGGNQSVAARLLGITRQALNRRLNRAAKK